MEIEPAIVKRWRSLGYPTVAVLAEDMGISYQSCIFHLRKATKFKVYESKMNYMNVDVKICNKHPFKVARFGNKAYI